MLAGLGAFAKDLGGAFKSGMDLGVGRGLKSYGSLGTSIGLGAVGAGIGALTTGMLSANTVDPMAGAAVGGAIGASALPLAGLGVGAVGTMGVGLATKGLPAIGGAMIAASPYVAGAGVLGASKVASGVWGLGSQMINWNEGADVFDKVAFTGPISGAKRGWNKATKYGGVVGAGEKVASATKGVFVNGKMLMGGTALAKGIGSAWGKVEKAQMGTNMGVVTNTPRIPSYSNNANATGDLVFAMNSNRRG